ncbi:DUF4160 domain-containing protein [Epibacterium ulvae]|uniref:DUF4160 domain-containing protein n=1 Tax=Epibacterium ulvae TaxID=1156985 RepID=UPI003CD0D2CD
MALADGYKFEVFSNDHDPPHFHIQHDGYNVRFDLETGLPLPNQQGNRKIERAVKKHFPALKSELRAKWDETRF